MNIIIIICTIINVVSMCVLCRIIGKEEAYAQLLDDYKKVLSLYGKQQKVLEYYSLKNGADYTKEDAAVLNGKDSRKCPSCRHRFSFDTRHCFECKKDSNYQPRI